MGQNMNWAAMQNAVQANHSALWNAQMRGLHQSAQANCQTFNPLRMEMMQSYKRHETCKHYDRWNGWCNLMEQPAAVAGSYTLGGKCGRYEYWEPKSQMDAINAQRAAIYANLAECCCESKPRAKFETIPADVFETVEADAGTILKNEPRRNVVEIRRHMDGDPDGVLRIERKVVLWDEHGNRKEIGRTPERKPMTLADLYSLAFPSDPIQAYFDGVYSQIEKEHRGRMETLERVQVKPVECPVRAVEEHKEKPHTLEAVRGWLEFESYLVCGTAGAFPLVSTTVAVVFFFEGGLKDAAASVLTTGASFAAAFLAVSAVSFLRFLIVNRMED